MPYGIDVTGFEPKPLDVINEEMKTGIRGAISPTLNLGSRSLLGQFVDVVASQIRQLWEAQQAGYAARDPNQATGDALRGIAAYTGTVPRPATPTRVGMMMTLNAGTYPIGTLKVSRVGSPEAIFANSVEITTAVTGSGQGPFAFEAVATGPTSAPANTLTVIVTPVAGFASPTNPTAGDEGNFADTDAILRLRRQQDLARKGSTSVDAIRADLLSEDNVPGVDYVAVLENETDVVDANGLQPHSIEAIVLGGADQDIADTIFNAKAAGIYTNGSVLNNVTDSSGNTRIIRFSRPTDVAVKISMDFDYLASAFVDDDAAEAAVKAAILDGVTVGTDQEVPGFTDLQGVGLDVIRGNYYRVAFSVPGVVGGDVAMAKLADGLAAADIVIGPRERATLLLANISVSATRLSARA